MANNFTNQRQVFVQEYMRLGVAGLARIYGSKVYNRHKNRHKWVLLQTLKSVILCYCWWWGKDLDLRSSGYDSNAL